MKTYFGNYLGIVINNNDPEFRGRVQVLVPHIMPTLFEKWNEDGKDITLTCVGDNIPQGLTSDMIDKLKKILPWAEAASPIIGQSSAGNLANAIGNCATPSYKVPSSIGGDNSDSNNSSPSTPNKTGGNTSLNQSEQEVFKNAAKYAGSGELGNKVRSQFGIASEGGKSISQRACARGTFAYLGAMTNNPSFQTGSVGGDAAAFTSTGGLYRSSSSAFNKSGLFEPGQPIGNNKNFTPQIGDVVATGQHIQVYNGQRWVSDFVQNSGLIQMNDNAVLYRMNDKGLAAVQQNSPGLFNSSKQPSNALADNTSTGNDSNIPNNSFLSTPGNDSYAGANDCSPIVQAGSNFDQSPSSTPSGAPLPDSDIKSGSTKLMIKANSNCNTDKLAPKFIERLNAFYEEANRLGYSIACVSAWRSYEEQVRKYVNSGGRQDANGNWTGGSGSLAVPGHSAHNHGIAVDLTITGLGVSITGTDVRSSKQGIYKDTPAFQALLNKYRLHQPLHPNTGAGNPEHWHIEPLETNAANKSDKPVPPGADSRGSAAFAAVYKILSTQTSRSPVAETVSSSQFPAAADPLVNKHPSNTSMLLPPTPST